VDTARPAPPDVSLTPEQPPEVVRAVAEVLLRDPAQSDPWWRAGLEELLEP